MPSLVRGSDTGGTRYFLAGRPIHAGDGLELRLPGNHLGPVWVSVRVEVEHLDGKVQPVLYLYLGHAWERRFRAFEAAAIATARTELPAGAWVVYDERRQRRVALQEHAEPEEDFPSGRPVYAAAMLSDQDWWPFREGAEREARSLQETLQGFPAIPVPLREAVELVELRWPEESRG